MFCNVVRSKRSYAYRKSYSNLLNFKVSDCNFLKYVINVIISISDQNFVILQLFGIDS